MKKRGLSLLVLFIIFLSLIGFLSAAGCSIKTSCGTGEYRVMGLSALTNAHGQLASQTGYPYSLCCDFVGSIGTSCTGTNKIIGLSAPTNAHAEIPSGTTYTNNVCYEDLDCIDASACDTNYPMQMLSLSATTNAHIANATGTGSYSTKICCMSETFLGVCSLTNAFWSKDGTTAIAPGSDTVMEGTQVKLVVEGTNCNGVSVSFEVREDDEGPATTNPDPVWFNSGKAIGTWTAEWINDGWLQGDPEFYFIAKVVGNPSEKVTSKDPMLKVTEQPADYCPNINLCGDYTTQDTCNSDSSLCNVSAKSAPSGVNCNDPLINCDCSWNSQTSTCEFVSSSGPLCGNNVIDAGEQCDGTDWGNFISTDCTKFDAFTGGNLLCIECKFSTINCTGGNGFGPCGDNKVHRGETCDGNEIGKRDWGLITGCQDFNEFDNTGILSCGADCQFNTSLCVGGPGWDPNKTSGMCKYQTSTDDDCSDGLLTYSATWIDKESEKPSWCVDRVIQCPAQVKLPFFNKYSLIVTIILIALIYYAMMILRKKKMKLRKKAGSRRRKR